VEGFADWLTAPENPFFARVAVNRIWQWHFGEGLQKTPSDFGTLGGLPTNQKLLDWLASEFVARKFSMKEIHRLMVTSETYQRASSLDPALTKSNSKIDPADDYLWAFRLQRLEAEPIWDCHPRLIRDAGPLPGWTILRYNDPGCAKAWRRRRGPWRLDSHQPAGGLHDSRLFDQPRGGAQLSSVLRRGRRPPPCPLRTRTVTRPRGCS
jgi:Protein of unknown function (DUF1553).